MSCPPKRKPRPLQPTRQRFNPRRGPDADDVPSPDPIFASVLRTARGIHEVDDPMQVEVLVSSVLAMFDQPLIDIADPVDFLGQRFVTYLVGRGSPDALALLHGIAVLAEMPLAGSARAGIGKLRAAGLADPAFAARTGRYRFLDAWTSMDDYGDQEMVAVSFADPADKPHALAFMTDHNFDGLVREAFLAAGLDELRRSWSKTSEMAIVSLDAQALSDRLGQGLRMYEQYLDPPCSDAVRDLAALMRARLRALPPPREPEHREVGETEREEVVAAFAASREAGRSPEVADLARYFVDYRFDYADGDPLRWSPIAVELCLLDWFPRKVTLDDDELPAVLDTLRRFVRYAGRRKGLSRVDIAETLGALTEFEPQFLAAMRDPTRSGPAKSIVAEMLRDGVALTDERAVADWIESYNARPFDERDAFPGPDPRTDH